MLFNHFFSMYEFIEGRSGKDCYVFVGFKSIIIAFQLCYNNKNMIRKQRKMNVLRAVVLSGMVWFILTATIMLPSCKTEIDGALELEWYHRCEPGQWASDSGGKYSYRHDCDPYYSEHFTVYSDGSSTEAKKILADLAEDIFSELIQHFMIRSIRDELQFSAGYTYYIYAQKHYQAIRALGYRNGFFIAAVDNIKDPGAYYDRPDGYRYVAKHEMTHVFQLTLIDYSPAQKDWLDVWFCEGQANHIGGVSEDQRVTTLDEFYEWFSDPTHVNPISIHQWSDFPDPDKYPEYYHIFPLAYVYLVDSEYGLGATIVHIRQLFQLMKEGDNFSEAFAKALGISLSYYEKNFYSLMEDYLTKLESKAIFIASPGNLNIIPR